MRRVTEPLRAMGAHIEEAQGDALPLTIRGGRLHALTYTTPVASAQVKSALLFAGLTGDRKSTRLNSSHGYISYAVFCLKKKTPASSSAQTNQALATAH